MLVGGCIWIVQLLHRFFDGLLHAERVGPLPWREVLQAFDLCRKEPLSRGRCRLLADGRSEMNRIYISDHGDDKNDGRTRETAIYSWKRAIKLCDGNAEAHLMQGDATLQRLAQEIERRKRN